jgi:hypothetical protein
MAINHWLPEKVTCKICSEIFDDLANIVIGRCCKFGIYHRSCMAKFALNTGMYHFKCPLCGGKNLSGNKISIMNFWLRPA